ncbi:phosphatidylethanolamine-binding protein [Stachybotrys elegans]|uniref:Phosphatidylethanolamine-binding protein n=1 Tax=Stachybotrys elegans TaxID=80388 RepID=A0A8K0SWY8_9HYPO|nr:phosphatidylethanolamine-binding protein [Stachybotrys elegans]
MMLQFVRLASVAALLVQFGQSGAQSPPGFSPQTNNTVSIRYVESPVTTGSPIPLADVRTSPAVQLSQSNSSHIVLMVDLDAPRGPSNSTWSPILHWLIAVPAGQSQLSENQTLVSATAAYFAPAPPEGTGPHRYVVLELENPSGSFEIPSGFPTAYQTVESRLRFNVSRFVQEGDFRLVGANWFTVEYSNTTTPPSASSHMASSSIACIMAAAAAVMITDLV